MMLFDLPLEELKEYKPTRQEPEDFDQFWSQALQEAQQYDLDVDFQEADFGLKTTLSFDVTFSGYGGQRIKAWLMLPRLNQKKFPCVVEYIGYGGGRGYPLDWLTWSTAGYAHLVMDTRGQGSSSLPGVTPDLSITGDNPQVPGFMTRGILDPNTYYYKRLYVDAVRACHSAASHPEVDPQRILLTGRSQGGGIALAVAGLMETAFAVMPDLPFLCNFQRAVTLVDTEPYNEISRFLKIHRDKIQDVFRTLAYFDGMNFAARAEIPALFSVGLMDMVCPPSTVFAAYNHYAGKKDIRIWEFNEHEGGGNQQVLEQIQFVERILQRDE